MPILCQYLLILFIKFCKHLLTVLSTYYRCSTSWTLPHAYNVLIELATGSTENLQDIVLRLIEMHHNQDPELSKIWNVSIHCT